VSAARRRSVSTNVGRSEADTDDEVGPEPAPVEDRNGGMAGDEGQEWWISLPVLRHGVRLLRAAAPVRPKSSRQPPVVTPARPKLRRQPPVVAPARPKLRRQTLVVAPASPSPSLPP
jgi:hypothetical protein